MLNHRWRAEIQTRIVKSDRRARPCFDNILFFVCLGVPLMNCLTYCQAAMPAMLHRYCTFWAPLFSSFFCLLLSPEPSIPSPALLPCPVIPVIPFLIFKSTVDAIHAEYTGTAAYIHQALLPTKAAPAIHAHVQYSTSHMNSVNPLASKSSPDFRSSPFSAYCGRPIFSSQNSIASAGAERRM